MGIFSIANQHIRFAVKLATAIVLALFVGFHFQLETPRWAVLTAAIVAAGPAFAAGGEPYSGAIRYRGFLRIIGTFIGCIAGLVIIIAMIRAPLLMILVCCIWAGFCTWISSLVRIENSYAWGLAGYTALIIVITIQPEPLLTPQFAVERCSEIVIGIVCAIMADLLFSPRSIKQEVDRELESLLVAQYQLMQLCIKHGDGEVVDKAWGDLVFVAILFASDHHCSSGARRPDVLLLVVETNTNRNTLRKTHPFKVRVYSRHPFVVTRAAGVGDPCGNFIDFNTFAAIF